MIAIKFGRVLFFCDLSLMKKKGAKEKRDATRCFLGAGARSPAGHWGGVYPISLSPFLSLMKEKEAKENQGDDRHQFLPGT